MKTFETPVLEVMTFSVEDVITVSTGTTDPTEPTTPLFMGDTCTPVGG